MERWLTVPGHDGYEVSDFGRVRSLDRSGPRSGHEVTYQGRILKLRPNSKGYLRAQLSSPSGKRFALVHRLVAQVFVPGEAPGLEVCHYDNDHLNNAAENLRWDTRSNNNLDKRRFGTDPQSQKTHCPNEHPYSGDNLYVFPDGRRDCRRCRAKARQKYNEKHRKTGQID